MTGKVQSVSWMWVEAGASCCPAACLGLGQMSKECSLTDLLSLKGEHSHPSYLSFPALSTMLMCMVCSVTLGAQDCNCQKRMVCYMQLQTCKYLWLMLCTKIEAA